MSKQVGDHHIPAGRRFVINVLFVLPALLLGLCFTGPVQASGDEYERYEHERYEDERYEGRREESKLYGIVEKMPENGYTGLWIIDGREVVVSDRTKIKREYGRIEAGRYVKVEGVWNGPRFTAYEIELEHSREYPSGERMNGSKLYGTVEAMPQGGLNGIWRINGREVVVTGATRIKQEHARVAVGVYVEVEGGYSGNTFTAYEIEVQSMRR